MSTIELGMSFGENILFSSKSRSNKSKTGEKGDARRPYNKQGRKGEEGAADKPEKKTGVSRNSLRNILKRRT